MHGIFGMELPNYGYIRCKHTVPANPVYDPIIPAERSCQTYATFEPLSCLCQGMSMHLALVLVTISGSAPTACVVPFHYNTPVGRASSFHSHQSLR
jgi:hypothetical protein